jgi:hypothetical protein
MRKRILPTIAISAAILILLTAAQFHASRPPSKPLSMARSFAVTDKAIVSSSSFTLDRVLTQLVARSGVTSVTAQQLIRQMFDTQTPRPGLADATAPHCDDTILNGVPSFNGFPRRCPTAEATLAATPYTSDEWFTLGLINRFDVAPPDGSNCGQYRLVFAHRENDPSKIQRLHLIFEAVLPNPHPEAGLAGCRPVAQFWSDLSSIDSMDLRRQRLEKFFFEGLDGFAPVVDPPNFAEPGGIRSLQQRAPPGGQRFYQVRLAKNCEAGDCTLRMVPDVIENSPFGLLADGRNTSSAAHAFRDEFIKQVATLAIDDINLFHMQIPKQFLMVESNPNNDVNTEAIDAAFDAGKTSAEGADFKNRIQAELTRAGSTITPENVMRRAAFESCFACHGLNGNVGLGGGVTIAFSPKFASQFISEDNLDDGEAGPQSRFGVDPIIQTQFAPHRMQILQDFLRNGTAPEHSK